MDRSIYETKCRRLYRQHCADVLQNCPKDKLLVLENINCGWEVLCNFTGKDIPVNTPWPHKNKNASITHEFFLNPNARMPKAVRKEAAATIKWYGKVIFMAAGLLVLRKIAKNRYPDHNIWDIPYVQSVFSLIK